MSTELSVKDVEFNTRALAAKEMQEAGLKEWMDKNLKRGVDQDYEYTHVIWRTKLKAGDEPKDCLLDPGTAKIMGYMGVRPKHAIVEKEIDIETMNTRYVVTSELVTILPILYYNPYEKTMEQVFPVIAEGVGSATTREKRYKVKWEWFREKDLITSEGYRPEELADYAKKYPDRYRIGTPNNLYYMASPESLGLDNTLLKMAAKRAEMDAIFQIPGVAQRFSQAADLTGPSVGEETSKSEEASKEEEPTPPAPAPKVDWNDKIAGEIEAKYRLTPKEMEGLADDIIKKSDGLTTTRNHALSILKRRLDKAALIKAEPAEDEAVVEELKKNIQGAFSKPPTWVDSQIATRMIKGVSRKDAARDLLHSLQEEAKKRKEEPHDIPDDLLQLATEVSKATGKTLKEISDAMEEERDKAAGLLTSEAALHWVANKLGAPVGTGAPEEVPIVEEENPLGEAIKQELRRLNLPVDLRVEFSAVDEALLMYPTKFLGDRFTPLKDYLEEKYPGTEWIRAGSASHFKVPV